MIRQSTLTINSKFLNLKLSNSSELNMELSKSSTLHVELFNSSALYVKLSKSNVVHVKLSNSLHYLINTLSDVIRRFIYSSMILDTLYEKIPLSLTTKLLIGKDIRNDET